MCLEVSFSPFTRDTLNFRLWKCMLHRPAVFRFHSHHCASLIYRCAFCSVTAHAHHTTGHFYVVYLFLFAVVLLCCGMLYVVQLIWATLVKSPSLICSRYALLTCADNTALSGFIFCIRLLDVSLHRIIISIHFPLIYAIWWALTHKSLYEWMAESVFPLPHMTLVMISASPISVRT